MADWAARVAPRPPYCEPRHTAKVAGAPAFVKTAGMKPSIALCLLAACLASPGFATAAATDVYRWRDAQGAWHYSDTPVPGAERIRAAARNLPVAPAAATGASSPSPGPSSVVTPPARDAATLTAATRVQQDLAAQRAEGCRKARETYEQAIAARRLYRAGKDGEAVLLTDAEVEAHRVASRVEVDALCGK
ncbi:MAG: hypothetical protein RL026_1304 [Pseudomonadota bacterium]